MMLCFSNEAVRDASVSVPLLKIKGAASMRLCSLLVGLSALLIVLPMTVLRVSSKSEFLGGVGSSTAKSPAGPFSQTLIWQDEFAQPVGSGPDPSKWTHDLGDHGWGNAELQCYTDSRENAFVVADAEATDGRALVIRALRDSEGRYTSARIKTQGKFAAKFGRIEARLKLPKGQSVWAAFWTLGATIGECGWPECGEIDIMELLGHEPDKVYGTIHGPGHSGGDNQTTAHYRIGKRDTDGSVGGDLPRGDWQNSARRGVAETDFSTGYHVFAVEWQPGRIEWFVDGERYHSLTPADLPEGARWVFDDTPQFILLNLAVGGHWPGYPDDTTEFPQDYRIDYVRVWGDLRHTASDVLHTISTPE